MLIRNTAVGLNFVDPGHRSGLRTEGRYETPLPIILGTEGAGIVEKLGPGVTGLSVGDRVGLLVFAARRRLLPGSRLSGEAARQAAS